MNNKSRFWIISCCTILFCYANPGVALEKPPQEPAREKLLMMLSGEWISRGIYVATKLEIADHLQSGPKSTDELAKLTQSNPESLQRLLHMLAGFGIFDETQPGTFANTDTSRLLIKSSPDTLHDLSLFYGEDIHKAWDELLQSIQTNTPAFQLAFKQPVFGYFKQNPARAALFQEAMKEKSMAVIKSALTACDFTRFKSVYDIGGGYGQFIQALLRQQPHTKTLVFELPEVIDTIKKRTPHFETDNCKLLSGDFFTSIPTGADAYLLKSVIHDWDDEKAERILKNCHQAMQPNSRLLIVDIVIQPKDHSPYANCMDLLMLAITGGKERTLDSFTQLLSRSGFTLERIYSTSTEFSILEAKKK